MEDGSTPLKNSRHERFALMFAQGEVSAAEAYRRTISDKGSRATVETEGPALARSPHVSIRIEWLKRQAEVKAKEIAGETVLSIAEKRLFCARLVRAQVGLLERDSDLWNSIKITEDSTEMKLSDKLSAIKVDNDLAVHGAEAGANKALEIIIRRL